MAETRPTAYITLPHWSISETYWSGVVASSHGVLLTGVDETTTGARAPCVTAPVNSSPSVTAVVASARTSECLDRQDWLLPPTMLIRLPMLNRLIMLLIMLMS